MDSNDYCKSVLALVAEREARSNGINGMLAVAFVIRNRVQKWEKSWYDVICSHNQFSSMTVKGDSQTIWYPDPREPNFQKLLQSVDGIFDGTIQDTLTNGAIYYANLATMDSAWFKAHIINDSQNHPQVATIAQHVFYA
jgi:spore germination cell wall hydrolase CwlJ-like protein